MIFHTLIVSSFSDLIFHSFGQLLPQHTYLSADMIFGDKQVYFSPQNTLKMSGFFFYYLHYHHGLPSLNLSTCSVVLTLQSPIHINNTGLSPLDA